MCYIDLEVVALVNCCKRRRCDLDEDGNCMGDVMMSLSSSSIGWFHDVMLKLLTPVLVKSSRSGPPRSPPVKSDIALVGDDD